MPRTGTTLVEIALRPPSSSPVNAVTVTNEVMSVPELVMNALLPLSTQPPSRLSARVRRAAASEPEPGSVRQNAAMMILSPTWKCRRW